MKKIIILVSIICLIATIVQLLHGLDECSDEDE